MRLTGLLESVRNTENFRALLSRLNNERSIAPLPIIRAARPYLIAALAQDWRAPIIYITGYGKHAHNISEQLPVWLGDDSRVLRFSEPTPMFYDRLPWDQVVIHNRIETLTALSDNNAENLPVVIASARAVMQRTLPVNQFRRGTIYLKIGQRHNIETLMCRWIQSGYEPATIVVSPGTFSKRGGILDIYPLAASYPVRIEFFDDEIESIRQFDPEQQRSIRKIETLTILPAREALPERAPSVAHHLKHWFESLRATDEDMTSPRNDAGALENGLSFPYLEHYMSYFYPQPASLLDYAPDNALIILEDPETLEDTITALAQEAQTNFENNRKNNLIPPDYPAPYFDWHSLAEMLKGRRVLQLQNPGLQSSEEASARLFTPEKRFGGQLRPLLQTLRQMKSDGDQIVVVTQQTPRLRDLWHEQDLSAFAPITETLQQAPAPGSMTLIHGILQEGWTLNHADSKTHLITDAEIFGWARAEPRRRKPRARQASRIPESDYADWEIGDYVVHEDYGIGRFIGLQSRAIEDHEREYIVVEYAGTDTLFVPIHQADRLTRYVGADEKPPDLSKLGKPVEWLRRKRKARQNAEEEARELLRIYARRQQAHGFAYSPDGPWQHELEASFPYIETEDQLRVTREVKADMQDERPMDRLICGDAGYGKTEVAARAAFKAIVDGKQVAVIAPTTVLAQQHYETFKSRMEAFPVHVEMLSRFRTGGQQTRIVDKLKSGEVDIVIGTHRLFSKDIEFKNLGLIIIDEEQRFGVKHKEHFKKLRAHIDFLTLTATPIPRTLYMSLSGIRDISMIQTPPEERLPVITHVGKSDEKLIRQAILRELDRGGQVFVVHNRVKSIEMIRQKLAQIVPEARFVVAHGQMNPRQLEAVIQNFSRNESDVLCVTSIIENGVDMPNVNTLIVDRADWFGVAQLYQLRGRVGRSAQQAYAYFFHNGVHRLTEEARSRLETLAEHTELGSGFQIAIKDLEIRGAGDILSTRQSGHVAAIGLRLYTQLLKQAVRRLKDNPAGERLQEKPEESIIIDLPLPAYIPTDWIPEMSLRLQIYRRIGNLQTPDDIEIMREELRDRFGQLPTAVEGLLYQMRVKLLARQVRATAIVKPRDRILIKLPYLANIDRAALERQLGEGIHVTRIAVEMVPEKDNWQQRLIHILQTLKESPDAQFFQTEPQIRESV